MRVVGTTREAAKEEEKRENECKNKNKDDGAGGEEKSRTIREPEEGEGMRSRNEGKRFGEER